jgi:hypothetical protein
MTCLLNLLKVNQVSQPLLEPLELRTLERSSFRIVVFIRPQTKLYLKMAKSFQKRLFVELAIYPTMLVEIKCHASLLREKITFCTA